MRVAALQHDIVWEDPQGNHERLAPMIRAAADDGARLVVLTEMYATGFSMAADLIAEPPDGPSTAFLVEQASSVGAWVCGSVPTRDRSGERPVNRFVLAGPGGELHRYDKIHPFSYAGEHEHYRAGDTLVTVDVEGVRVAPFVCYDLRFADEFWAVAPGIDLYVVVANWPAARRLHWQALLQARAIENQAFVVGANRVGHGDGVDYCGDSRIVDPLGELIATAEPGVEQAITADVDPAYVRDVRARFPFLRDRRPPSA